MNWDVVDVFAEDEAFQSEDQTDAPRARRAPVPVQGHQGLLGGHALALAFRRLRLADRFGRDFWRLRFRRRSFPASLPSCCAIGNWSCSWLRSSHRSLVSLSICLLWGSLALLSGLSLLRLGCLGRGNLWLVVDLHGLLRNGLGGGLSLSVFRGRCLNLWSLICLLCHLFNFLIYNQKRRISEDSSQL